MKTACPLCQATLETPYILLGAAVNCPTCQRSMIPEVPLGTVYPKTGYELTYRDFCRLLADPSDRLQVVPLLRQWFGYDAPLLPDGFCVMASDGSRVPPLEVHEQIQADAGKQYALYQKAMTLWR